MREILTAGVVWTVILTAGVIGGCEAQPNLDQAAKCQLRDRSGDADSHVSRSGFQALLMSRKAPLNLVDVYARTAQGHRWLRRLLASDDPNAVRFAGLRIGEVCDLDDVQPLLSAAIRFQNDAAVVHPCVSAIKELVGKPSLHFPGLVYEGKGDVEMARAWVDKHKPAWAEKEFAEYWGEELLLALKTMREEKADYESQEFFGKALFTLLLSRNAESAVPAIMRVLEAAAPDTDTKKAVRPLIKALQCYVGKIDMQEGESLRELTEDRTDIIAWWRKESSASPGRWTLSMLERRGIPLDCNDPAYVLKWISTTLHGGSPADQYSASLLLSYCFPDSESIFRPDGTFLVTGTEMKGAVWEYIVECQIAHASFWRIAPRALQWNSRKARYCVSD